MVVQYERVYKYKISIFIMDLFTYQLEKVENEENITIRSFSADSKQNVVVEENSLPYVIYMKKEDFEALKIESDKILLAERNFKDKNDEIIVRIEIKSKELCDFVVNTAKEADIKLYEADLPAEHRYLIDNSKRVAKDFLPLKYISVDIETIGEVEDQRIVLISTFSPFSKDISKVYVDISSISDKHKETVKKSKFKDFKTIICENEEELLNKVREDILKFEPQLILGWNVIDFDFKVIKERMDFYKIPFSFSNYNNDESAKLRVYNDFFKTSTLTEPGLLYFDVIVLLKMNFIIFDDYKLDTVAREVLGDSKIELENAEDADQGIFEKINAISHMLKTDPVKLIEYNFKDSFLTSEILEKLKLIELTCKRSIITNTPLNKVKSPIASLDLMYLEKLHKRGQVAFSNFNFNETTPIEGAYVMDPKQGFYEDIFVFDFKSLYPTVIMTFNIDPFTYTENKGKGLIEAPNGANFIRKEGILPDLIDTLYEERNRAKKAKDDVMSHALKITMNSFYGAVASPKSRFHNKEVGNAITAFARKIIKQTDEFAVEFDLKPIYNDTDSAFLKPNKTFKNKDEKVKYGKEIEKKFNDVFKTWVKENYNLDSKLEIEFEKLFAKFFIASKKRYVGYDEISGKNIYVGIEAVRGDWTNLARKFQMELIDFIFADKKKEDIKEFIHKKVEELKKGKYDDLLIYTKKITKPLHMYTKTTPPHVRAARELDNFTGRVVKYIMTKDGPKHIKLIDENSQIDYEHYIEKQLKGVSDDILESFGLDFDEIMFKKQQKSLDSFF